MKKNQVLFLLILLVFTISCKNNKKEITKSTTTEIEMTNDDSNDIALNKETTEEAEETAAEEAEETKVTEETTKTDAKEKSKTVVKNKIDKVVPTANTSHNAVNETVNEVTETAQEITSNTSNTANEVIKNTTNEVTETVNTTAQEVVEKPEEIVTETVQEVIEEVVETPKPKPVQELTKAQKIAKGKVLFNTGICKTCHDPKKKKIGPPLKVIGSKYKAKKASISKFLAGNAKPIVWPDKFMMMKPNIDDVTSKMPKSDLDALEAYILSLGK